VAAIAQYLDPAVLAHALGTAVNDMASSTFWAALLQIVFINILLSGDNAVVIALACRGLPPRQRFWGMVFGAGVAVLLRISFAGIVAELMLQPYLKVAGGMALIYIAAKLVVPAADKDDVEPAAHLLSAVRIVVIADVVMSLDNIIAIAAAAQGHFALLALGLIISIPIIIGGSAIVIRLLNRFPILVWAGAALLGWIAGGIIATDPAVSMRLKAAFGETVAAQVEFAAAGAGILLVLALGGLWRQLHLAKAAAGPASNQKSTAINR
jgi:YjbE family integral membrane protein